jgi:selenocysteine-specific elongation factor
MRLWADRSFSVKGSGTVVTGTLGQGRIRVGDEVVVRRAGGGEQAAVVRGLQSLERPRESVDATARVAVNLRGVQVGDVRRGDVLLTPHAWRVTTTLDVQLARADDRLPAHVMMHAGTVSVQARLRPLGPAAARLSLPFPLPVATGDRVILRDPGTRHIAGALVVDADPPALSRRGAAARRAVDVAAMGGIPDLSVEVARRDAMTVADAAALGIAVPEGDHPASSVSRHGRWLVADAAWARWEAGLRAAAETRASQEPLAPTLTFEAARAAVGVPDRGMMPELAAAAGLEVADGSVGLPGRTASLGTRAELGRRGIEDRLADRPFASPEQKELDAAGLGPREIAAAVRAGRLLRLPDDVLLKPNAPAHAMRVLAALPQPFTTSEARVALDSTRRTVIPLLEYLDARGWTRRVDDSHREVCR